MSRVFEDVRPLTDRLVEETRPHLTELCATPFVQAIVSQTLTREAYGNWLLEQYPIHEALDQRVVERRDDAPLLRDTATDFRLHAPHLRADLKYHKLEPPKKPSDAARAAIDRIAHAAEHQPLALFGYHYVREAKLNLRRHLAQKLREAWGCPGQRDGFWFLDPHGVGQYPLWARFCRDVDKHRLTEDERAFIVEAAGKMLDTAIGIYKRHGTPPAGEPRPVPVSF